MANAKSWALLFLVLLSVGCSRPQNETSTVAFDFANSALSDPNEVLEHLALNISDGSTLLQIYKWDKHSNTPLQNSFTVSQGDNRLIQVLAVYKNTALNSMVFKYGDVAKALKAANEDVTITLTKLNETSAVVDGQISGRYLTSANTGPTGLVNIYYKHPGREHRLLIESGFMVSGWFSLFMLSGVNFEYEMDSTSSHPKLNIFGGPKNINMFNPAYGDSRLAKATVPVHARVQYGSGGTTTNELEDPAIYVWGIWGPQAAHATICNDLDVNDFTRILKYASPIGDADTALDFIGLTGSSFPTPAALKSTMSPLMVVNARGGTSGSCGALSATELPLVKDLIDGNGKDSVAGFRNIFVMQGGEAISAVPDGTDLEVSGILLPGADNIYTKVRFYTKTWATAGHDNWIDYPVCGLTGPTGFTDAGEVLVSGGEFLGMVDIDTTADPTAYDDGRMSFVACGVKADGVMAPIGYYSNLHGGGGGGGGGAPEQLSLDMSPAITDGECLIGTVSMKDSSGFPASDMSPVDIQISVDSGAAVDFFEVADMSCSSPNSGTYTIAGNDSSVQFRYKAADTVGLTSVLKVIETTAMPLGLMLDTQNVTIVNPGSMAELFLTGNSGTMNPGFCREIVLTAQDFEYNTVATETGNVTLNMYNMSGGAVTGLYTTSACNTTAQSTLTAALAAGTKTFYTKMPSSGNFRLVATYTSADAVNFTANGMVNVVPLTSPTNLVVTALAGNEYYSGNCIGYTISPRNDSNAVITVDAVASVMPDIPGGAITPYSDANCTVVDPDIVFTGSNSETIYFRADTGALASMNFMIQMGSTNMSNPFYIHYNSPSQNIAPVYAQLSHGGGLIDGTSCYPVTLSTKDASTSGTAIQNKSGSPVIFGMGHQFGVYGTDFIIFTDAGCTPGNEGADVTLAVGTSSTTFYVRGMNTQSSGTFIFDILPTAYLSGNLGMSVSFAP